MLTTAIAATSLFLLRLVVTTTSTMSITFLLLQLVFPHASSNFPSPLHPVLLCFTTSLGKVLDRTHVTLISTMAEKYGSYANDETLHRIFNEKAQIMMAEKIYTAVPTNIIDQSFHLSSGFAVQSLPGVPLAKPNG